MIVNSIFILAHKNSLRNNEVMTLSHANSISFGGGGARNGNN